MQVVPPTVWEEAFSRLHSLPDSVRNVVFVSPVPVLYPKVDVQLVLNKLGQKAQSGSSLISQIMQVGAHAWNGGREGEGG